MILSGTQHTKHHSRSKIPVCSVVHSFKSEQFQEHKHPGKKGRVARHNNAHALPLAFEADIEVIHDVLQKYSMLELYFGVVTFFLSLAG